MLKTLLKFTLLFLAITAVYLNHFDNDFHFDDSHSVVDNPYVRDLSHLPRYFTDSTTFSSLPANRSYRPVLTASLALDYYLGGGYDLFYFHLSTFLLFLLQLIFQYYLYKYLLDQIGQRTYSARVAFLAVAIYGLHPVSAETVNYIIQRGDLHSTLGTVAGLVFYFYFPKIRKYQLYLIPVILGALSKPPAIMFAPILFSYIYLIENSASLNFWRKHNFLIFGKSLLKTLPAIIACGALYVLQDRLTASTWTPGGTSTLNYIATQPYVWLYYFKSFFLPTELHIDIELAAFTDWTSLNAVIGYCFVAFVTIYAYQKSFSREGRLVSFLILWCFFTLAPTSFIPLAETVNDHRMFFPYVALTLSVCLLIKTFMEDYLVRTGSRTYERIAAVAVISIIIGLALGTVYRNQVWHSESSIWEETTIKSPNNGRGLMNYGLTKMAVGDYQGAKSYFKRAEQFTPNYYTLEVNLGIVENALGNKLEAEKHFLRAIALSPRDTSPQIFYAKWLLSEEQVVRAIQILQSGLQNDFSNLQIRHLLMQAYQEEGEQVKLQDLVKETLGIYPRDETTNAYKNMEYSIEYYREKADRYLNKSLTAYNNGKYHETILFAEKALSIRPEFAEAFNNLSAAYAKLENWDLAIKAAEEAIKFDPEFQLAKNNLQLAISKKQLSLQAKR